MKRKFVLVLFLLALSGLAGWLLSKASLAGRVGISLFYKQYQFLKVWWQAGLLLLVVWMILFLVLGRVQQKATTRTARWTQIGAVVVALIGLYLTYQDFRHTTAHRWLGERFHLGGYLFWVGWIITGVFYLTEKREPTRAPDSPADKDVLTAPGTASHR